MKAIRRCWWCGYAAEVNTSRILDNGLLRDDSTMDGSESWICDDDQTAACAERAYARWRRRTWRSDEPSG